MGNRFIDPCLLDLCTGWRCVVIFMSRQLFHVERAPETHSAGLVGLIAGLGNKEKRKFMTPTGLELQLL
jgi:hypothetical protein